MGEDRSSRKKAPEGFMSAQEAAGALGIPPSTFRYYVSLGLIPRELPEGRSEGYYLTPLIRELVPLLQRRKTLDAALLRAQMVQIRDRIIPRKPAAFTDWITFADLPFVQQLNLAMYGIENAVDMATTWRWWQANPHMCRVLFNAADRKDIWGAFTALPMREETIFKLLRHEMTERDITPADILIYQPGQAYSCFVPSLVILPERRAYLRMLIGSFFDFWCELSPQVKVDRLYASPASEQGMYVIHHLFFSPRYDLGENAFELRPSRKGNPSLLIQSYQRCLQQKSEGQS